MTVRLTTSARKRNETIGYMPGLLTAIPRGKGERHREDIFVGLMGELLTRWLFVIAWDSRVYMVEEREEHRIVQVREVRQSVCRSSGFAALNLSRLVSVTRFVPVA